MSDDATLFEQRWGAAQRVAASSVSKNRSVGDTLMSGVLRDNAYALFALHFLITCLILIVVRPTCVMTKRQSHHASTLAYVRVVVISVLVCTATLLAYRVRRAAAD